MASEQVVVQIYRGEILVNGAVYPLHPGNWIDVADKSCEPEDAKRFLIAGAPIPYTPGSGSTDSNTFSGFTGEWHIETTDFGHYLLFDGPERTAGTP